jgi:hypothetical protein
MKLKRCSRCLKQYPHLYTNAVGKQFKECVTCYTQMREMDKFRKQKTIAEHLLITHYTGIEPVDEAILNRNDSFSERYNRVMKLIEYKDIFPEDIST